MMVCGDVWWCSADSGGVQLGVVVCGGVYVVVFGGVAYGGV